MKPRFTRRFFTRSVSSLPLRNITLALSASSAVVALSGVAQAQWLATPGTAAFGTSANWTGGLVNGNFTGTSTMTTLSVANDQQIPTGNNLIFSGATTPTYTIGLTANAGYFDLFSGAGITMAAGVTTPQIVNAGFNQAGSNANKANIITASAVGQSLTINGNYNTQTTSGSNLAGLSNYLNLSGTGGIGIMNGIISDGRTAAGAAVLGNIIVKKQGTATYTLNGVNTYTGGTEMGNGATGTVTLGNNLALGTGAIRVMSGTGGTGSGFVAGNTLTGLDAISNTFNYVGSTATATNATYAAFSAGATQLTINTAGTGTPVVGDLISGNLLSYFPNYTRVTAVTGSGVGAVVTLSNAAGQASATTQTGNSAAFNSSGSGTSTISGTNAIEFSGTQNLTSTSSNLGTATQTFNITNSADTIFSGVLQQQGGTATVVKTGAGKLIFTNANSYTGATTVTNGTLQLGSGSTSGSLATAGTISIGTGANLTINRSNAVVQGTDFSSIAISGAGSFTQAGAGTTTFNVANTYTGGTTISAGTLQLGNGGTTGSLSATGAIVNNGILFFNRSNNVAQGTDFSNTLSGSGSLVFSAQNNTYGQSQLSSASNSYTGTTTISNGYVNVGANSILSGVAGPMGLATSAIVIGDANSVASTYSGGGPNAVLIVNGPNDVLTHAYTIDRNIDSSSSANVAGRNDIGFTSSNGAGIGTLTISGNWVLNTGNVRSNGLWAQKVGQALDFTGAITGGNSATSFRANDFGQGDGSVRLSNSGNTYASRTVVAAGTLLVGGDAGPTTGVLGANTGMSLGDFSGKSVGAMTDGAYTVGKAITLADIRLGTEPANTTANTWTLGGKQAVASSFTGNIAPSSLAYSARLNLSQVAGGTATFSGVIAANPNITYVADVAKIGAGTVVLSGANTYDGTTAVTAGTLLANNTTGSATGAGLVSVATGATLGGIGVISGQINVSGVLAPGASIESLGTGNLNFATGSTLSYELNSTGLNGDLLASSGLLDIASGTTLSLFDLAAGTLSAGSKLTLISYFGGWTSGELFTYAAATLADDTTFTLGANEWLFNYNDSTGGSNFSSEQNGATSFVTMTVIPEPAAVLLGGLGLLTLLRRRRNGN